MEKLAASAASKTGLVIHLDALHTILRHVAGGGLPSREHAVDYLHHRSHLLNSAVSNLLPGFLYQCGTIDRFRDFIYLYDPHPDMRREFVDRMIGKARAFCTDEAPPEHPGREEPASVWKF